MNKKKNLGICSDFTQTMISKTTMIQNIPSSWTLVEKGDAKLMPVSSTSTLNIVLRREVKGISSLITYSFQINTHWITDSLATYMGKVIKDFYNLRDWEVVCYYHHE